MERAARSGQLVKTVSPALLALLALWLARGLAQPVHGPRAPLALVLGAGAVALAAVLFGVTTGGMGALTMHAEKPTLLTCIVSIPLLSALPLRA